MTPDCPTCRQRADQVASLAHTAATCRSDLATCRETVRNVGLAEAGRMRVMARRLRLARWAGAVAADTRENACEVAMLECLNLTAANVERVEAERDTILGTLGARIEAARAAHLAEIRALRERVRRLTTAIRGECEHPDTTRWRERARVLSLEIAEWSKWTRFNSSAFAALREQRDRYRRVVEDGVAELARSWRAT